MNLVKIILRSALPNTKWLMRALAASAEVFLHHTFGERYTSKLLSGLVVVFILTILASLVPQPAKLNLMPLLTAALFVRLLAHLVSLWQRRRAGIHVETHSSGSPWSFWSKLQIPAGVIQVVFEPLLCLAVAMLTSGVDPIFSAWIGLSGFALMVKTVIERWREHNHVLDVLDTRVSAGNLHTLVNHRVNLRPQATDTPTTVNQAPAAAPRRPMTGLFQNLDPALQRLVQEEAPAAAIARSNSVHPQPMASVSSQSLTSGRIHVRPAMVANHEATLTQTVSLKPRVLLVRTRPNPVHPLRVGPIPSPRASTMATNTLKENERTVLPNHANATIPKDSEVPNGVEIRKSQDEQPEPPAPARDRTGLPDKRCAVELPDGLCHKVLTEAKKLGFSVELNAERKRDSSTSNFILTGANVTIALEIAVNFTGDVFERIKRSLGNGLPRMAIVSQNPESLKTAAERIHADLSLEEAMKVSYFTPEEFSAELLCLAQTPNTNRRNRT